MAATNALTRHISWPPSHSHSIDEYSSLLHKSSHDDLNDRASNDEVTRVTNASEPLDKGNLILIMSCLWLGAFTSGLDGTIMATLAAPIATEFHSLSLLAWLATAYLIGQGAAQPLSGRLTDIFSRQWGLVVSNCLFATGNIICGLSQSRWTMIAGRVVAGLGGGCLISINLMVVSDLVPPKQRGLWQGLSNVFWGLGNGLGGLFGGYMNDTRNWRYAFLAQVPITVASLIILYFRFDMIGAHVKRSVSKAQSSISRVDFLGSCLLVVTMVLFLLGITVGGNVAPWSHPLAWAPLPVAAVSFGAFIYVERNVAREPILPLQFLKNRTILCACLTTWFFNMVYFVLIFYVPIYYRIRGVSTTRAGTALIPMGVTLPLGSVVAGVVTSRTGRYKNILRTTTFLMLLGAIGATTNSLSTPLWLPSIYLIVNGFAMGGMLNSTLLAFTSAVDRVEQALVISLGFVFRSTGSVMGVAIGSAVYQGVLERQLWDQLGSTDNAADLIGNIKSSLHEIEQLPRHLQTIVRNCYLVALRSTFSTTVAFATFAVVTGFLVKEWKLHSTWNREEDNAPADATDGTTPKRAADRADQT